ncbi:Cof-type HAD-IIB family hydrolase [Clostridium septicum]|uniref:Cof-type HAD-IIB family hydrolase n=1 Tax=Clostridium septicum TaxID=1504 RepID=A0A9N7JJD7_CLOSE|nr:HAD family hydrolase [Clostridium septicum]AYE33334.1 haloacid dehalogenase [Clostridium septicum]MDU1313630.1 HAD family hydrolase [Clostridium septicum]QAS61504.1 HAD family phosphatase [Clostridium septicum]UEC22059.1 Cof-type HAD-IIB family hydrolase [Clostridium septicum]USR99908.1 Cof-type HAD-IIB family hydrolase [Clostridium septicum]
MIKLIATDLDGTLLDENSNVPHEFSDVLKEITDRNIKFVAASGRPYYTLKEDFGKLANHVTFVSDNGAMIVENDEMIHCNIIEKTLVKEVINIYKKLKNAHIVLCGKECAYIEDTDPRFVEEVDNFYYKKEIVDNIENVDDDIVKITFCDFNDVEKLSEKYFAKELENKLQVVVSGKIWLDIMDNKTNKGVGLKKIQDKYAITSGETMVFGDYYNDIPMFEKAFFTYAMDNSPEEVKLKAKYTIESNSDYGVIKVLKDKYLKNKGA